MPSFEHLLCAKHFVHIVSKSLRSPVNQAIIIMGHCVHWTTELWRTLKQAQLTSWDIMWRAALRVLHSPLGCLHVLRHIPPPFLGH